MVLPVAAAAEIYRYVDAEGNVHFSDRPIASQPPAAQQVRRTPEEILLQRARDAKETVAQYSQGLLWKVHKPNGGYSYVLGTVHVGRKKVLDLYDRPDATLRKLWPGLVYVCTEILPDPDKSIRMIKNALLPGGMSLRDYLSPADYTRAMRYAARAGFPVRIAHRLQPWFFVQFLAVNTRATSTKHSSLDGYLVEQAEAAGLRTCSVEDFFEHFETFSTLKKPEQVTMLLGYMAEMKNSVKETEAILKAYLAEDLRGFETHDLSGLNAEQRRVFEKLQYRLLAKRNARMVLHMQHRLQQGNVLMAVGAAHLPGATGVLHLLAQQGYSLERVPLYQP